MPPDGFSSTYPPNQRVAEFYVPSYGNYAALSNACATPSMEESRLDHIKRGLDFPGKDQISRFARKIRR